MIATQELLTVSTREHRDHHTVSASGELDMATAPILDHELLEAEARDSRPIVIDLSELTFMDSSGIHLLLDANARTQPDRLSIVPGPRAIRRIFELTGTDALLPLVDA